MAAFLLSFAGAAFLVARPAAAQNMELRPTVSGTAGSTSECGSKAALYSAGKIQVWVTRKGTMREDNPLRPLSSTELNVLQVVVNGRSATAFGVDFDNMRQGGAPARLEEASGHPIAWEVGSQGFPASFRVVSEDGRVLVGPLAFESCGDPPAFTAEKPGRTPPRAGSRERQRGEDAPNRPGLPQGAIPSGKGGGLALPQP